MEEKQKYTVKGSRLGLTRDEWDKFIHELYFQHCVQCAGDPFEEQEDYEEFVKQYKLIPINKEATEKQRR